MARHRSPRALPVLLALALSALPPPLASCGPVFDDAHHGYEERLRFDLASICEGLFVPGAAPAPVAPEETAAADLADPADAAVRWAAIAHGAADARVCDVDLLRTARDRLDLLPLVRGGRIAAERWQAYLRWDGQDPAGLLTADHARDDDIAVAALATAAARLIGDGRSEAAEALLARARRAASSAKGDEVAYLTALAPALAGIRSGGPVADPAAALARLAAWLAAHPDSPWRTQALGWEAYLLWHHPDLTWGDGSPARDQAARIWTTMLTDGSRHELFLQAVDSLRWAWRNERRLGQTAWTGGDPRVAVAVAAHALTDHETGELALGTALEPVLAAGDPAAAQLDPALAQTLALAWYGHDPKRSLPFARRAFAAAATPAAAYLLGRCAAETGSWEELRQAARSATGGERSELLGRIGFHDERRGAWRDALQAYLQADARLDLGELARYGMPLADLEAAWSAGRPADAAADSWAVIERCLAFRRVWDGRFAEAAPLFHDDRAELCRTVIRLQEALAAAGPDARAGRLFALARFWDDQGRRLLWGPLDGFDRLCFDIHQGDVLRAADPDPAALRRLDALMESVTAYVRSEPLYLEIVTLHPDDPLAPEALFRAAECRYWLCGSQWYGPAPYWESKAAAGGFWKEGDARLRRLAQRYPDSPWAREPKVAKALAAAP